MTTAGIVQIDIHGMTKIQAEACINSYLKKSGPAVYRLRVIHGYQHGTELCSMIRSRYKSHPKVLRVELSLNPGQTDLVLREL